MGMSQLKEHNGRQSELVLVTLQGPERNTDLALPLNMPIKDLIPYLMRVHSLEQTDERELGRKPIWVVGYPNIAPFGMHETLAQNLVVDGAVLSLWNLSAVTCQPALVEEAAPHLEVLDGACTVPTRPARRLPKWSWALAPVVLSACVFGAVSVGNHPNVEHPLVSLAPPTTSGQVAPPVDDTLKQQAVVTKQQPSKPAKTTSTTAKAQPKPSNTVGGNMTRSWSSYTASTTVRSRQTTITSNTSAYWIHQGNVAQVRGNSDMALTDFLKAIKLGAHNEGVYAAVGDTYLMHKQDARSAVQYYQKAIDINPHYGYAWNGLIDAENSLGLQVNAAQCLSAALQHVPRTDPYMPALLRWKSQLNVQ